MKRIKHVEKYIREKVGSLAEKARHLNTEKQRTTDFGPGSRPDTLMLRERIWRFEMSRSKAERFFRDHKLGTGIAFAVLLLLLLTRYILVGFASTVDFYPSSCLGNWENVQNALGKPDLGAGSSASAFTSLNSAVFGTSSAQMFCGNFSGSTDINSLMGKSFQSAELVLSWSVVFPQDAAAPVPAAPASGGGANVPPDVASSSASSTIDAAAGASSSVAAPSPLPPSTPPPAGGSSDNANPTIPAPGPATIAPEPSPTPPPTEQVPAAAAPTSWLRKLIGVAYADQASSTAMVTEASTTMLADSSTPLTVASSAQEGTPTAPQPTPINVNTSIFQNIILPSSTVNEALAIVYSTDGVTWQPLANIDISNWRQARYTIPISSWQELQHLQVAFVGLGASSSPQIFLDAAGVTVSYIDTPVATTDIASSTDNIDNTDLVDASSTGIGTPATSSWTPPPEPSDIIQKPTISETDVFSQGAHQQCVVAPFSQTVAPGGSKNFSLQLYSGLSPTSTQHAVYQTQVGSLPAGISASILEGNTSDTSSTQSIHVTASRLASQGSYSVLVLYRERQDDASMRSTGCQMNVVIQ